MPDVPAPGEPFVGYWGKQMFLGHFSEKSVVVTLSSTYVRCVFAAREDYLAAGQYLRSFYTPAVNGPMRIGDLYRGISRLESCIGGMHLAVRSMTELRKRKELAERERSVISETTRKPRFLGAASDLLRMMRNKMQHIEDELARGRLKGDLPIMIQPTGPEKAVDDPGNPGQVLKTIDRLRVHKYEVRFEELACWLGEMVEYAELLHSLMPISRNSSTGKVFAPTASAKIAL
ncbi:hypothetical protein KTD33_30505 [Burkholderia gladioli]|nr:hypothetical protein [Burkholderia gladioli]